MISVVVPLFNEAHSLELLTEKIKKHVAKLSAGFELLYIDDGSTDDSLETLKKLQKKNPFIKIYSFRKNQGKSEALALGFEKAQGELIVTLDADLQDVPSEIPKLVNKIQEGYDVVSGWRKNRKDEKRKVLSSRFFNFLAGALWGLDLHDYNCGLKAYTSEAAKSMRLYGGLHRFIPLLAYLQGFKVTEVVVEHEKRKYGVSKFGFSKVWWDLPDIFTMLFLTRYSKRPLHFFGMIGGVLVLIGIIILVYLSIVHFQGYAIGTRPLLFFGGLFLISGFQVFFTGFLADMIINIAQRDGAREDEFGQNLLKYVSE